jgi:putative NIF3 family GTP cyclohydrolase 1 type 2
LELDLQLDCCFSVSTDGVAPMAGQKGALVARIRETNPNISWQHCIIHKKAWSQKKTLDLQETLNISVKAVNLIKSRALNSRLLKKICKEMGSTHIQLLLHTKVRWLS